MTPKTFRTKIHFCLVYDATIANLMLMLAYLLLGTGCLACCLLTGMTCFNYNINKYTSPDCTNKIFTAQLHDIWEVRTW